MSIYDVIIVGLGSVGAVAANFLGSWGVRTLVLERETTEHGQPRAFSCDDEALRIYQQIGLDTQLRADMAKPTLVDYSGARGQIFAEIHFDKIDFGFGFHALNFFHQPRLEAVLRQGLTRFNNVTVKTGQELKTLQQSEDGVSLEVLDLQTQQTHTFQAQYVLGADGGKSTVRKLINVALDGMAYEEPWLAVSGTVPDEHVRLDHTRFVCDPKRPSFVGRAPFNQYRIEFMLLPGETREHMEDPATVKKLVSPYVDPDHFEIQRAAVYTFHNALAQQWQVGRVFLLGDAAHMMPPFMGQGLVSGLRDVANLTWKLALVLRGSNPDLLSSYEVERRSHTQKMADISIKMGGVFLPRQMWKGHLRDGFFTLIQKVPAIREFLSMMKFKPMPIHPQGFIIGDTRRGKNAPEGTYLPQPTIRDQKQNEVRLDDVLGRGFAVIGLDIDPRSLLKNPELWSQLDTTFVTLVTEPHHVDEWQDHTGTLTAWFKKHQAQIAIVRPDRFVYAAGAGQNFSEYERLLGEALLLKADQPSLVTA